MSFMNTPTFASAGTVGVSGPGQSMMWVDPAKTAQAQGMAHRRIRHAERGHETNLANIEQTPARLQHNRFNTVFPWIQQQFGSFMDQFGQGGDGGSQVGQQPQINASPIYSNQQVSQQVASGQARNQQAQAAQQQAMQESMAGRGFGANSPLAQALQNQFSMGTMMANQDLARDLPFQVAGQNAQHLLQGQQAQEAQFANRQQEQIERAKVAMNPLLTILGGFGGLLR